LDPIPKEGGSRTWSHDMPNVMEDIETPSPTLDVQQAC